MTKSDKKFLIIDSRPFGLFSILMHTVDNIKWAEENGYIPVVRWGPGRWNANAGRPGKEGQIETKINRDHPKGGAIEKTNFFNPSEHELFEGFAPSGFEENGNMRGIKRCLYQENDDDNPWEYYFEPLNEYTVEEALQHEHLISDIFQYGGSEPESVLTIPYPSSSADNASERTEVFQGYDIRKTFIINSLENYGRVYLRDVYMGAYEVAQAKTPPNQPVILDPQEIAKYNNLQFVNRVNVQQYISKITVKSEIIEKAKTFILNNFESIGAPPIGIHIRGTDKCSERHEEYNFGLRYYISFIENFLSDHKHEFEQNNVPIKIFLATDSHEIVNMFQKIYGKDMIVTYPSLRMNEYDSDTPIPLSTLAGKTHGEQCLIEAIILSRCQNIIGSDSNMSIFASYMNPAANFCMIDTVARCALVPSKGMIRLP